MSRSLLGSVYTTCKYGTGNSSASRSASHRRDAAAWHFGQCLSRHELKATCVWPHAAFSQRATWPPSAAAAALDCAHHLQLVEARVAAVGLPPGGTVLAENVRELQDGPNHGRRRYRAGDFPASRVACLWRGGLRRASGLSTLAISPVATRV